MTDGPVVPRWAVRFARGFTGGAIGAIALLWLFDLLPAVASDERIFPVGYLLVGAPIGVAVAFWTKGITGFVGLYGGGLVGATIGLGMWFSGASSTDGWASWAAIVALFVLALVPVMPMPGYLAGRLIDRVIDEQPARTAGWRRLIRATALVSPIVVLVVGLRLDEAAADLGRQGSCPTVDPAPGLTGRMAFVVPDGSGFYSIAVCVTDVATGEQVFMFEGDAATDRSFGTPSWSPDGSAFAVEVTTDNQPETVIVPLDGTPPTTIAPPDGAWSVREPDWSPDGERLATVVDQVGCGDCGRLALYDLETGRWAVPLTTLPEGVGEPDWSPDGDRLVVRAVGDSWLAPAVVLREDGAIEGTLVDDMSAGTGTAAWSPDGRSIALARRTLEDPDEYLWVVAPDASAPRQITLTGASDQPAWSPDGEWLAFDWYDDDAVAFASQIWVTSAQGGDQRMLVDGGTHPSWAP